MSKKITSKKEQADKKKKVKEETEDSASDSDSASNDAKEVKSSDSDSDNNTQKKKTANKKKVSASGSDSDESQKKKKNKNKNKSDSGSDEESNDKLKKNIKKNNKSDEDSDEDSEKDTKKNKSNKKTTKEKKKPNKKNKSDSSDDDDVKSTKFEKKDTDINCNRILEKLNVEEIQTTGIKWDTTAMQPQYYPKYGNESIGLFSTKKKKGEMIHISSGGIPKIDGQYVKSDKDRQCINIPLDKTSENKIRLRKYLMKVDDHLDSDDIREEFFKKNYPDDWQDAIYVPAVKSESVSKKDSKIIYPERVKMAFNFKRVSKDSNKFVNHTRFFKKNPDGTKDEMKFKTIDKIEENVPFKSEVNFVFGLFKIWTFVTKTEQRDKKDKKKKIIKYTIEYGAAYKIFVMEYIPATAGGKENNLVIDSFEDEPEDKFDDSADSDEDKKSKKSKNNKKNNKKDDSDEDDGEPKSKKKNNKKDDSDEDEDEEEPKSKKKNNKNDSDEEEPKSKKKNNKKDDSDEEEPKSKKKNNKKDDSDEAGSESSEEIKPTTKKGGKK
jgi:hypothetical protein